jgi:hypothetical protein
MPVGHPVDQRGESAEQLVDQSSTGNPEYVRRARLDRDYK